MKERERERELLRAGGGAQAHKFRNMKEEHEERAALLVSRPVRFTSPQFGLRAGATKPPREEGLGKPPP